MILKHARSLRIFPEFVSLKHNETANLFSPGTREQYFVANSEGNI